MKKKIAVFAIVMMLVAMTALSAASLKPYKVTGFKQLSAAKPGYMVGDEYTAGWYADSYDSTQLYNLKNAYRVFTATVGPLDSASLSSTYTIEFYVDGNLVKTMTFNGGDFPEDIELNLNYQRQLRIVSDRYIAIVNADFK